ncbi:DUF1800 family protein [Chitinibacter bivalviorum]|uniref:DUF1800 family protein n=1 Tax=Chitinibacter bivalviorum TaxID=2739434 RepID=A0A7H9BIU0_9NEIS|nr:DUF1800 family protein [Chitinibacter bivalviorum]QLG88565.1 DUF1800 family protein [Chitinibacter bivalviorum]
MSKLSGLDEENRLNAISGETLVALGLAAGALSACGGGGGTSGAGAGTGTSSTGTAVAPLPVLATETRVGSHAEAARFLAQAGFGGDALNRQVVISQSLEKWLIDQLAMPQGQSRWDEATALKASDPSSYAVSWEQIDNLLWKRIATYPDVLRQRMALALSEIFVVNNSGVDVPGAIKVQAMCGYMDLLEKSAFGNFRQLLEDVTLSVPMGRMLGTLGNQKEDLKTGRRPDENYAREVMQLFTIGLYELNADGSIKKDASGQPLETYSIETVSNLARVFTGWSTPLDFTSASPAAEPMRQPMSHDPKRHSLLEKKFLGVTIPAGTDGPSSLKIALDTLFNHPNVGPFIGKQLIQRFVCSNPSPAYVARVAASFANNGLGVRGDLRAVICAVLLDAEARKMPAAADGFAGKVVEPMVRVGTLFRAFKFSSPDGQWRLTRANNIGQRPLDAPSVFNFFRPGYVPPNTTLASNNQLAPELQIVSEQTVLSQANTYQSLLSDAAQFTRRSYLDANKAYHSDLKTTGLSLDLSAEVAMATQLDALIEHLNLLLAAGQLSATTKLLINNSLAKFSVSDTDPAKLQQKLLYRVQAAILMVLMAPDAQVLK